MEGYTTDEDEVHQFVRDNHDCYEDDGFEFGLPADLPNIT